MNGRYLITRETLDRDGALEQARIIAIIYANEETTPEGTAITHHRLCTHPALTDEERAGLLTLAHNLTSQLSGRSHA